MKKHFSVFQFYIRCTFLPFLGLMALMAAAETSLFALALSRVCMTIDSETLIYPDSLETVLASSHISWVAALFFLLTTALLAQAGCEYGSKTGYTLRRLSISERSVFWWQAAYNTCCYLIFWAAQLLLAMAFCLAYTRYAPAGAASNQTVFLAFYRDSFLHGVLPLSEPDGLVRNLVLALGLGMSAAYFPYRNRRGKFSGALIIMAVLTLWIFPKLIGDFANSIITILYTVFIAAVILTTVYRKEVKEDALA